MEYNEEYIKGLLFEKIAGTISERDDLIAERAILMYPGIKEFWEQLLTKMNHPKAVAFVSNINENNAWTAVEVQIEEASNPSSYKLKWPLLSAVAVFIFMVPLAWYFIAQQPVSIPDKIESLPKGVYLKTDVGEAVDLSGNRTISLGDANISSKQKEMTYESVEADSKRWATLVVPVIKDYKIKLSDGTIVWMNAASTLRFPFSFDKKLREVYLTGEAYFEVAKNKEKEFIVHTEFADIRVHGTSFNVNAYDSNNFATSLVEGSVSAGKDSKYVKLKPGEELVNGKQGLTTRTFDSQEVLSWRNGTYFFHNRSLAEIAQVLNRWFDVKIVWESPGLAEQTFTGEIDKSLPLDVVISNLQLSSGIKAHLQNGTLTFK